MCQAAARQPLGICHAAATNMPLPHHQRALAAPATARQAAHGLATRSPPFPTQAATCAPTGASSALRQQPRVARRRAWWRCWRGRRGCLTAGSRPTRRASCSRMCACRSGPAAGGLCCCLCLCLCLCLHCSARLLQLVPAAPPPPPSRASSRRSFQLSAAALHLTLAAVPGRLPPSPGRCAGAGHQAGTWGARGLRSRSCPAGTEAAAGRRPVAVCGAPAAPPPPAAPAPPAAPHRADADACLRQPVAARGRVKFLPAG